MASTYTTNQGLEKPATGDRSGTWGTMTNTNMDMLDRSISGVGALSLTGTATTLTTSDGSASDGNYKVLVLGGSPSGTNTITLSPNDGDKLYFVVNASGQSVIFTQGTGANVTIANGAADIIYADGAGSGAAVASVLANDLVFKTGDGVILNLQTSDTTVTAASVLGRLNFTAPDEASGTDAILLAASIAAISEGTFAADNNATKLSFLTGASEAAAEKMSLSSGGNLTVSGTYTGGGNIVSDTDSTDDLGTTGVRWANLFVDAITATDQVTATGFTGTLDGILGSGAAAAATVTTLVTSGIVSVDDTTTSTSGTTGSIHTDGGLGVAGTAFVVGTLASGIHTVGTNSTGNYATYQETSTFNFKLSGDTASQYGVINWINNGGTTTGNMWGTGDASTGTMMRIKSLGVIALVPGGVGIDGTVGYNFLTTGFTPPSDNGDTNGTAALRWSVVYAGTAAINTSDEREKQQIADLDAAELRVALAIKRMVKKFKFNDAVAAKGDNARIHVGVIAQDVRGAFIAEGLDPTQYGLFCYDAWPEIAEEIDDEGTVITQAREAGDRFGIRYDELLAFIIAAI